MIETQKLYAGYGGRQILKGVSLTAPDGKVLALIGPNGCGKSTLLGTMSGLKAPDSGEIWIDGVEIRKLTPRKLAQKVAYMVQSRNIPEISAERMVLHGRFPYLSYPRRYGKEDYEMVRRAMEQADAAELAGRAMTELSGGQRQRIYLAMALAQDTRTILMDEPTTFLDVAHQLELMELAKRLAAQGKAVVVVLHDICLAMRAADIVVVMENGQIAESKTPAELFDTDIFERVFRVRLGRTDGPDGECYYYR